ncbi:DUF421 domain-containing protein [Paenibacillus xerothermodurans]|uniref:DUF421 domain-containing protein n=2 Tax=Paenibacillus xerothermodurans TaxID=1977292 RepID=A0A2W1NIB1_PAEXE|nr:DUF421 domain-containing protein [Paenibacillus xerothermodurans]PZE22911.1 DUF421 domain-containing protein [Paenibacillus xerothermodurans]
MLFILTRILGKKQISQLTFFEYITGITLGELAGFISTDVEAPYMYGVVALLVWFTVPLAMEYVTLRNIKLRRWLDGTGSVVIRDGKVLEANLQKERYNSHELMEELRKKNVFNLADVEFAILEASGDLNVLLKSENQPLTPKHLGMKVPASRQTHEVIVDGKVLDERLAELGHSRAWLNAELEKIGVTHDNVFIGQVDAAGQLHVDLYDDKITVPVSDEKKLLLATLKKCEADMTIFGLSTRHRGAAAMYQRNAELLEKQVQKLTPFLKQ